MNIETAIIPVAGTGTRVAPANMAIEKSLMPIYEGDKATPIVDFMVNECILAGMKRIIFITTKRGQNQLEDYFGDVNSHLSAQLMALGRKDILATEQERRASAPTIEYINQPLGKYGTAYPPSLAKNHLTGEKNFVVVGGDDFVYRPDGSSELLDAISRLDDANTDHVIMGNPLKSRTDGTKYGILQTDKEGMLQSIDERPPLERIPHNPIANISRYILSDKIWGCIDEVVDRKLDEGVEYRITDVINQAIELGQSFQVHPVLGLYFDCGSPGGMREASNYFTDNPRQIAA